MDNRTIDVTTDKFNSIESALSLIWPNAAGGKATHYRITKIIEKTKYVGNPTTHHFPDIVFDEKGTETLILYWSAEKESQQLPYEHDFGDTVAFIKGWLKKVTYPHEPDIDGSCEKGFRLFTDPNWGIVLGSHYGIVAVQPAWAMFGK